MRRRIPCFIAGALSLGLGPGCKSVGSEELPTSAIALYCSTVAGEGPVEADCHLKKIEDGTLFEDYVDLDVVDRLLASCEGAEEIMSRDESLGAIHYVASFAEGACAEEITISLERQLGEDAPGSVIELPESFDFVQPEEGASHSRSSESLTVEWTPSDDSASMELRYEGSCCSSFSEDVNDSRGSHKIGAGDVEPADKFYDESCDAELELTRVQEGQLDPALGDGAMEARVERTREIVSAP